jgi:general secretion pathway protein I
MAADRTLADSGFTLLEVLVAFVIAALALGALFNGATASLAATTVAGRYGEAMSRAQSHLAEASQGTPSGIRSQNGEEGHGFHWAVRIASIATAPPNAPDPVTGAIAPTQALYSIQVTESWTDPSGPRQIRIVSRRVGVAPP